MTDARPESGLLSPGWTGSPAASATSDGAYLRALLDAEAALTRAQETLGLAPEGAGAAVTAAASGAFDAHPRRARPRRAATR